MILAVRLTQHHFLLFHSLLPDMCHQWRTQEFCSGGGSTNSAEDKENGDLGAVAPQSGVLEAAVIWYKKFHFI